MCARSSSPVNSTLQSAVTAVARHDHQCLSTCARLSVSLASRDEKDHGAAAGAAFHTQPAGVGDQDRPCLSSLEVRVITSRVRSPAGPAPARPETRSPRVARPPRASAADAEFAKVCKQEAVPPLATLLPRVAATRQRVGVAARHRRDRQQAGLRRLTDADVEVLVRAVQKSGLPVEGIALRNHDITDEGVATLCKLLGDQSARSRRRARLPATRGCKGCELPRRIRSRANKTLKRLDLSWNPVGMRGGFAARRDARLERCARGAGGSATSTSRPTRSSRC